MTPERRRIAIAEARGWQWIKDYCFRDESFMGSKTYGDGWINPKTKQVSDDPDELPDYLNDENAMREAWMCQPREKRIEMHQVLMDIVDRDFPKDANGCGVKDNMPLEMWVILTFEATLAQRAEAFLKTLGLWQD